MSDTVDTRIEDLKRALFGAVVLPASEDYDRVRALWNGMIDKRPAIIIRCAETEDVVAAVNFARENDMMLAVRGGGHNVAGNALCDDGLVIDLSQMREVHVDEARRLVTVEGGALLSDLDAATQAHAMATPVGINSTTGIAGLTLGGGFGWISRKYGLTSDNLESAEVVLASGEVVTTTASEHPDLFWALRGGGGNFGVVTKFTFRLHPIGPEVLCGIVAYPLAEAKSVMQQYRTFMETAPDDLTVWVVARLAPPMPFIPEALHGSPMVGLAIIYAGDPESGKPLIEPLAKFGTPIGMHVGVQPFTMWQQMFDPSLPPGARNYWKSHNYSALDDGLIDAVIASMHALPFHECDIAIAALGGAVSRIPVEATAYPNRNASYVVNIHGRWQDSVDDARCMDWVRNLFHACSASANGSVYVNFMSGDETDRVKSAYGANYARLAQVKRMYDPTNLFRMNQNIVPA